MLPKQGACSVLSRESFVGISLAKLPVSTSIWNGWKIHICRDYGKTKI